jgi:DNA polymerase-3 subunit epsilon
MSDRHIVVVDCETTGLNPDLHVPIEWAWLDMTTGANGTFIPYYPDVKWVERDADPKALEINGYHKRIRPTMIDREAYPLIEGLALDRQNYSQLVNALKGNTFAGSNPSFDERFLLDFGFGFEEHKVAPWHHRKLDLANYAAGVLGYPANNLPGLALVAENLRAFGFNIQDPDHTALGDVLTTAECFRALADIAS